MKEPENIGGYSIHPAAAIFPLIEGDEFDGLVDSIIRNGVLHPVTVQGQTLLDGRNRMRAAEAARSQGHKVDVPIVEWNDDGRNVAEWIWDTNAMRRQMTEDGVAIASAAIWPLIAKENEARREAAQFKKGQSGNPSGKKQARPKSTEPAKRDTKSEDARSTVGRVASKAGTSKHKARQAIAVQKAIESGDLPAETAKEVMTGKRKLKDAVPTKAKPDKSKRRYESIDDEIRFEVNKAWSRLRGKFAPGTEHKKLRSAMIALVRNEQKTFKN